MKKLIAIIAALSLLVSTAAFAGCPGEFFEINGMVLTVRFPEGALETVFDGTVVPEALAEGETANGICSVSYILPESALGASQLFTAYLFPTDASQPVSFSQTFRSDEDGLLAPVSFEVLDNDVMVTWSEFDVGEKKLSVHLVGSSGTNYVWQWVPDNSGMFDLVETSTEWLTENEDVTGAPEETIFILSVNANSPITEGSLLFNYAAGNGDPERSVMIGVMTDGQGEVVSVDPLFMAAE
ncbi:MAG: hypothetical protein Q4G19_04730 [Clostridia bacterium]|nr:hypothetical protein [Clostridia bacterium]